MPVTYTVNGVGYSYPIPGDPPPWGSGATNWAGAITTGTLQKAGGTFTLTADVNFGANFGVLSKYFTSTTTNAATAGQFRLAKTDTVDWRNNANSGNLALGIDTSDQLTFNGSVVIPGTVGAANTVLTSNGTSPVWATIVNANVNASAAIAYSKLTLTGSILNADISASAAIAFSKLATLTSGNVLVGSAGNVATSVAMSGDVTIVASGAASLVATTNATLASLTKSTGIAVHGTNTNDSASASFVGEFISANPGGAVTPGLTDVGKTITSISLTAGDWDVQGTGRLVASSIAGTRVIFGVSLTNNDFDSGTLGGITDLSGTLNTTVGDYRLPTGARRISISSTTTVYLVGLLTYTSLGGATFDTASFISARRVR